MSRYSVAADMEQISGMSKQTFPKPDNIRFRDKFYGYKYSTMSIIQDGKNVYHAGSQLDPMLRAFFSDTCDRPLVMSVLSKRDIV